MRPLLITITMAVCTGCAPWAPPPEAVAAYRDVCRGPFEFGIHHTGAQELHFYMECSKPNEARP